MSVAGPEIELIPSAWSAAIATGIMISAKTRILPALARLPRALVGGCRAGGNPLGGCGQRAPRRAYTDASQHPVDVRGDEHSLDESSGDPRDDQAAEEDQARGDEVRQDRGGLRWHL